MAVWAGAGCAAAAVGFVQAGVVPRPDHAAQWLREQRDLTFRFFGEFAVSNGATQLSLFLIGALATLADVGQLRAGQIILGPLNILFQGRVLWPSPRRRGSWVRSPRKMDHAVYTISTFLTLGTLSWAAVASLLPVSLGQAALGANWVEGSALVVPLTIGTTGYALAYGPMAGLRALAAAPASLSPILDGVSLVVLTTVGAAAAGAIGAAWAYAVVGCFRIPNWWWHFRRARRAYSEQRAGESAHARLASDAHVLPAAATSTPAAAED